MEAGKPVLSHLLSLEANIEALFSLKGFTAYHLENRQEEVIKASENVLISWTFLAKASCYTYTQKYVLWKWELQ